MLSTEQEEITVLNLHGPSIRESKYIKQILIYLELVIDFNTLLVGDYNIQF
jgi:hypothetical protein